MSRTEMQEQLAAELQSTLDQFPVVKQQIKKAEVRIKANFEKDFNFIQSILEFLLKIDSSIAYSAPEELIRPVLGKLRGVVHRFGEIISFDPLSIDRAPQHRDSLIVQLKESYSAVLSALQPVLSFHNYLSRNDAIGTEKQQLDDILKSATETSGKLDGILRAAQQTASTIGAAKFAEIFLDESRKYYRQSRIWLTTIGLISILGLAGMAILIGSSTLPNMTWQGVLRFVSFKLFLASIVYILLAIAIRNFSALRHNATVNKHRACALQTFEAFTESAKDPATKDALLKLAGEAIFAPQTSGFLAKGSDTPDSKHITEILGLFTKNHHG